jgi:hypothetical protein
MTQLNPATHLFLWFTSNLGPCFIAEEEEDRLVVPTYYVARIIHVASNDYRYC